MSAGAANSPKLVSFIQRRIARSGLRVRVDGVFGSETEAAVRRFQTARRLLVDGIVGRQTMSALKGSTEQPADTPEAVAGPQARLESQTAAGISNFAPGEQVSFRLDDPSTGPMLNGSISPSPVPADGSASVSVTIPAGTSDGQHTVYAVGDKGSSASAPITVQALDHFEIDPVAEQHSGKSFPVTVRAKDAGGQTISAYTGPVSFSTNSGSIATATTNNFVDGVLEGQAVKITGAYTTDQTITASAGSPAKTGTSNPFTLRDWKLYLKKTASITSVNCPVTAGVLRDMEEGYGGHDPEETYARTVATNTIRFCSRAFSAGEKLAAGTTRLEGSISSTNTQGPCNVTATLYRNVTEVLGSDTQSIPQGTGTVFTKTWLISTPALTFAAGDRLSVVLAWDTTAICREAKFHYGGTTNRSRLELPGPGGSAYTDSVLSTAGLVSYWRLEEPTGTTASDSKGTNTATHSASFFRRTGLLSTTPLGTAAYFSNHSMTAPDAPNLSPTSELSVEAWVDFATCCSAAADIATKDWRLRKDSAADGNKYSFAVDTGNGLETPVTSTTSPASSNGFRAYLVATYDGANLKIYVNGKLEGTQPKTGAVRDGSGPLTVGGTSETYTQGDIDELAFYNRALTASEIRTRWNAR